jgi:hypothetical protein
MNDCARNTETAEFNIPFTQYLRPNGRKIEVSIERPKDIYDKAMGIVEAGYCFEIEVLNTGHVHMTITNDEGDQDSEVVKNGPEVPIAVDRMITRFHGKRS